jgi:hypothetical protein
MEKAHMQKYEGLSLDDLCSVADDKYFMARDILHMFNCIDDLTELPEGVGGHAIYAALQNLDELHTLFQVTHERIKKAA